MSELMTPAFAGAAAGLGVAMPMGAMSVLLIQEAMRSRRVAVAAAAGIAAVDLGYAAVATALGPWVASHVSPVEAWVRLTSALILLTIAAHGLTKSRHPSPRPPSETRNALPASPPTKTRAPLPAAPPPEARAPLPASPATEAQGAISVPLAAEARGPVSASPAFEARGPGRSPAAPTEARGPVSASPATEEQGPVSAPPAAEARGPVSGPPAAEARGPVSASPAFEARGPGRSPAAPAGPAHHPDPHPAHPTPPNPEAGQPIPAPSVTEARGPGRSRTAGGPGRAFARYVGLTALNPTTALYFAALTTAQGATLRTGAAGAAFLLGVGTASLLWQQTLVALAALAGSRISDTARVWTFRLGYGLVAAYAVKIALPLP